jgi:hypothetical protein
LGTGIAGNTKSYFDKEAGDAASTCVRIGDGAIVAVVSESGVATLTVDL